MSIIKLLTESLFCEDDFNYNDMVYRLEESSYAKGLEYLLEHAFEKTPDDWEIVYDGDSRKEYNFTVTDKTNPTIPKRRGSESFEEWNDRVKEIKSRHDYDTERTFQLSVTFSIYCREGLVDVAFKQRGASYAEELNIQNPGLVMNAVVFSLNDAMKRSSCPINIVKFQPIRTYGDDGKFTDDVDEDGNKIDINGNKVIYKRDENGFKIRVDADGNEITDPVPLRKKPTNRRALLYLRAMQTNKSHMDPPREIAKIVPADGIPRNGEYYVWYYFKPLAGSSTDTETQNITPFIQSGDVDALNQAIADGAVVTSNHIQQALKSKNTDIINIIASNTSVSNSDLITAARVKEYNAFLPILMQYVQGDIDYNGLVFELIPHDNIDLIQKLYTKGNLKITREYVSAAIKYNAKRVLAAALQHADIGTEALIDAMKLGNLDAVKMILDSGVKLTPDIIKTPTTKDIRAYLAPKLWRR